MHPIVNLCMHEKVIVVMLVLFFLLIQFSDYLIVETCSESSREKDEVRFHVFFLLFQS